MQGIILRVRDSGGLLCRFGGVEVVDAIFASSNLVSCATPSLSVLGGSGVATVEVTNNAHDWTMAGSTFHFHAAPTATTITPRSGPMVGGTAIAVVGDFNLAANATASWDCRFGATSAGVVSATLLMPGVLRCVSPLAAASGPVALSVSSNGVDFEALAGVAFDYCADPPAMVVAPTSGTSSGSTNITVALGASSCAVASGLPLLCRFSPAVGSVAAAFNATVAGVALNATALSCLTPSGMVPGDFDLAVSLNGQQFWSTGKTFAFRAPMHITAHSLLGRRAAENWHTRRRHG